MPLIWNTPIPSNKGRPFVTNGSLVPAVRSERSSFSSTKNGPSVISGTTIQSSAAPVRLAAREGRTNAAPIAPSAPITSRRPILCLFLAMISSAATIAHSILARRVEVPSPAWESVRCAALLHGSRWMRCAIRKSKSPSRRRIARRSVMRPLAAWLPLAASIAAMASEVSIEEWDVPTENSRPHDPAVAPDGALWFTEQRANKLGRLDPRTGQMKEFPLRTPGSGPHGLVADRESLEIAEYPLPDGARPRRLAVAPDGSIFYSDYARGQLGRFNPASRKVEEWPSPGGAGAKPYGIAVTPDGTVWFSESGIEPNTLVRFDPRTKKFSSTPIPSGGGVVRNMVATSDGKVYLAESGVNKVAIAHPSVVAR